MSGHFATTTLCTSLSLFAAASGAADAVATTTESHIRPTDLRLREVLHTGVTTSPTFRALVQALDASDVIVYPSLKLARPGLRGYLVHSLVVAGPNRYIRIVLSVRMTDVELVAVLAHELQHAVEVAQATHVRDTPQLRELFEQIGIPSSRGQSVR